jgi:ketosteroid isomerase-like protein
MTHPAEEHAILDDLNRNYIRAVAAADTAWFDAHLADDFRNTNPDGRLLGRAEFIAQIARGPGIAGLVAHDVLIRQFGDHAIIHARTRYTKSDGSAGAGWYSDAWHRFAEGWRCVAAHVSRG